MHTTLDESTGVRDERFAEHTRRSAFILAVHQAIEIDGLPAPLTICFTGGSPDDVELRMDANATGDVDDWAAHFSIPAGYAFDGQVLESTRPFRSYQTDEFSFANYTTVRIWCAEDAS